MVDKKYLLEYRGITIAIIILSILILALAIRVLPYNILAFIYLVMFLLIPCIRGLCLSKKICIFEKGIEEENIFGVEKSSYLWEEIYEIKVSSSDIGLKYTEIHFYIKHSLINPVITQDKSNAQIMLVMHALEKGMSFPSARIFGGEKAVRLIRLLDKHIEQYGLNKVCIVAEYLKSPYATRDEESRNRICDFLEKNKKSMSSSRIGGTKKVSEPSCFDKKIIEEFYASRVSVREYSDDPVTDDEIRAACRIASYTPSACNRQME